MGTHDPRPGRAPLAVVLTLVTAVLAGCVPGPTVEAPPSAPLTPAPAGRPSDASLCGAKPFGAEQPENAWKQFDVTKAQLDLIETRLIRVLCREGLWRKGVGFGANYDQERKTWSVVIHPGFSGLTARQILNRLLGT
jgi:hypothetical protein